MRLLDLVRIAGAAEALRLRLLVRRHISRVVQGIIGLIFLLITLGLLEAAAVVALVPLIGILYALLAVAGGNLLVAVILLILASRGSESTGEAQALATRNEALASLRSTGMVMTALQWGWKLARRR